MDTSEDMQATIKSFGLCDDFFGMIRVRGIFTLNFCTEFLLQASFPFSLIYILLFLLLFLLNFLDDRAILVFPASSIGRILYCRLGPRLAISGDALRLVVLIKDTSPAQIVVMRRVSQGRLSISSA